LEAVKKKAKFCQW